MRILRNLRDLPASLKGGAVAVGNFDGVHKGHRAVIGEAGRIARGAGAPWLVLTFEPHPRSVFSPNTAPFRITPPPIKEGLIADLGVDGLVELPFDLEFSRQSAETFIETVIVRGLGAQHVVSGYDFVFGHGRKGNCELLLHKGRELGFGFTSLAAHGDEEGGAFSATRVRALLREGKPREAAEILGRDFEIEGEVEGGAQRGRTIGFPTANVQLGGYIRPATGVYAVRAAVAGAATADPATGGKERQRWHDGVANFGSRPTFDGSGELLEVHLFDFAGDLYGKRLRVALIEHLRPEIKFDGIEALRAQIAADAETARRILNKAAVLPLNKQRALP